MDANKNHTKNSHTLLSEKAFRRHSLQGSMTVEASFIVPMIFFVWMACVGLTSVVYVHSSVQKTLIESARELSVAAGENRDLVKNAGDIYPWIQSLLMENLETAGVQSIEHFDLSESCILGEEDEILLKANYYLRFIGGMIPIPALKLSNQVYVRAWTGGYPLDNLKDEGVSSSVVFVSEHGQVYHVDPMCSHIQLSIFMVEEAEAKRYDPCDKCISNNVDDTQTYYITETGDHYHSRLGCSGLKRQIDAIVMSEVRIICT